MLNHVVIYEQHPEDFGPLTWTGHTYRQRIGMSTLAEKIANHECYQDAKIHFLTGKGRRYLASTVSQSPYLEDIFEQGRATVNELRSVKNQGGLFIDGAVIASLSQMPTLEGDNEVGIVTEEIDEVRIGPRKRRRVVYARLDAKAYNKLGSLENLLESDPRELKKKGIKVKYIRNSIKVATFPWKLVEMNGEVIEAEYQQRAKQNDYTPDGIVFRGNRKGSYISPTADVCPKVVIDARKHGVYIGENVKIQAWVALDATKGPIFIDDETIIESNSNIFGPAYIGRNNQIFAGARIRSGCSFGPFCKMGGEVDNAIVLGYSNKRHEGFMGEMVVGEWVNWAAYTSNSDMKNSLDPVVVELSQGRKINTGETFFGGINGDGVKTVVGVLLGVGPRFNTGTVIGPWSIIDMPRMNMDFKYLPGFLIYGEDRVNIHPLSWVLPAVEAAMGRRDVKLTPGYRKMVEYLYEQHRNKTKEFCRRYRKRNQ